MPPPTIAADQLVRCFYDELVTAPGSGGDTAAAAEAQELPPPELRDSPRLHQRWRTACKGLHWRLGSRLQPAAADEFLGGLPSSLPGGFPVAPGGGGGVYQSTSGAGAPNLDDLEQEIYENFRDPSR